MYGMFEEMMLSTRFVRSGSLSVGARQREFLVTFDRRGCVIGNAGLGSAL